jgi:hypothetical protein
MDGFVIFKGKHLSKVNALRMAKSQPESYELPILNKSQVLFVTAESREGQPNSCYNCHLYNKAAKTCMVLPEQIRIEKFTHGEPFKQIEYWPVCGMHDFGKPNEGAASYVSENDPDYVGLVWVNAPKVGQEYGGTSCGGLNGGDDCDYYMVEGTDDKRAVPGGFCKVLQTPVAGGDCCAAWNDDDIVTWREAQQILKGESNGG